MKTIIFLALIFCTTHAFSQLTEEKLTEDYKKSESVVSVLYEEIYDRLNEKDQIAFKETQDAWLKFRELNCKFLSKEVGDLKNSQMYCLLQINLQRIKDFEKVLRELRNK